MNQTRMDRDDRIEQYLDGLLDEEATRRFEQDLLTDEVAARFRESLLLRELLKSLPPDTPPPGLVERIESAMALDVVKQKRQKNKAVRETESGFWSTLKNGLRWSRYTFAGLTGGSGALKGSMGGLQTIGYSLGPLREPARNSVKAIGSSGKPLGKMALSSLWRRLTT